MNKVNSFLPAAIAAWPTNTNSQIRGCAIQGGGTG